MNKLFFYAQTPDLFTVFISKCGIELRQEELLVGKSVFAFKLLTLNQLDIQQSEGLAVVILDNLSDLGVLRRVSRLLTDACVIYIPSQPDLIRFENEVVCQKFIIYRDQMYDNKEITGFLAASGLQKSHQNLLRLMLMNHKKYLAKFTPFERIRQLEAFGRQVYMKLAAHYRVSPLYVLRMLVGDFELRTQGKLVEMLLKNIDQSEADADTAIARGVLAQWGELDGVKIDGLKFEAE